MNERVPLSFLLAQNKDEDPPVEPTVPFAGLYGEAPKIVTAVLERTVVLAEPSDRYERITVRHDQVLVDPAIVEWRTRTAEYDGARLLTHTKPGTASAALMGRHRRPSRSRGITITPASMPGAEARQASDERALKNQREVKEAKQRELAAHRQQQPRITVKHEEEEAMSSATAERMKVCVSCRREKPESAFPRGRFRAGRVCDECKGETSLVSNNRLDIGAPQEVVGHTSDHVIAGPSGLWMAPDTSATAPNGDVARADTASSTSATITDESKPKRKYTKRAKAAKKPRLKVGQATGKRRHGKTIPLGEVAEISSPARAVFLTDDDDRHTRVIALLRRQDALRADLKRVSEQLLELIAAG